MQPSHESLRCTDVRTWLASSSSAIQLLIPYLSTVLHAIINYFLLLKHVNQRCVEKVKCHTKATNNPCNRPSKPGLSSKNFRRFVAFTSTRSTRYFKDPTEVQHGSCQWSCERCCPTTEASPQEGSLCHPASGQSHASCASSRVTVRDHGRTNCQPRS